MPRRATHDRFRCQYFAWLLYRRDNGYYYADGRGNPNRKLGRHALGTDHRDAAIEALHELDRAMAVREGLAPLSVLQQSEKPLAFADGVTRYLEHAGRPQSAGGTKPSSLKRYRPVFDKFAAFAESQGVAHWNLVDDAVLTRYLGRLEADGYAPRTVVFEGTVIKQAIKFFIGEGLLPDGHQPRTRLMKITESSTYCYSPEQVKAMLQRCREIDNLGWLGEALEVLAYTGMRVGELAQLRWRDVDLEGRWVHVRDESSTSFSEGATTKGRASRSVPLNDAALDVLRRRARRATAKGKAAPPGGSSVFHGPRGGRLSSDLVCRRLKQDVINPLAERWELARDEGFRRGVVHSLRHYFCSRCAASGIPEATTQKWLGHKSSEITRLYYHLHDDEAHRQMTRLTA